MKLSRRLCWEESFNRKWAAKRSVPIKFCLQNSYLKLYIHLFKVSFHNCSYYNCLKKQNPNQYSYIKHIIESIKWQKPPDDHILLCAHFICHTQQVKTRNFQQRCSLTPPAACLKYDIYVCVSMGPIWSVHCSRTSAKCPTKLAEPRVLINTQGRQPMVCLLVTSMEWGDGDMSVIPRRKRKRHSLD